MATTVTKILLQSILMVFLAAGWAYVCIMTDMNLRKTDVSSDVQNPTGNRAVSVRNPVHRLSMDAQYILNSKIIRVFSTYRQETVQNGIRNMTEELLWNAPTSVRNKTIN